MIYPKCEKHPSKACELHCKDCNIFLCYHCLALKEHNEEHELLNLEELFIKKRKHIQKDKAQLLPVYKDVATELEDQIAHLEDEYKQFTAVLSKHREQLHKQIDDAMNHKEEECLENKMKHHDILKKQLDEIKQSLSLMQEEVHALNEMDDSNEVSPTILFNSKIQDFYKFTPKLHISMPIFIPKQIETAELNSLIGKIISLSTTVEERVFTEKKPNALVKELLDEPVVLQVIKTGHANPYSVTCLKKEEIWTGENTAIIKCFNTQGVLQKTIKTKLCPRDNKIRERAKRYSCLLQWGFIVF